VDEKDKYTDNQVDWLKKYFDAEVKSIREAVDKVEATNKAKFEAQNEWRQQFKDQTGTFVTRRELIITAIAVIGFVITILLYKK
jgi:preprotein translocase subunit SecE